MDVWLNLYFHPRRGGYVVEERHFVPQVLDFRGGDDADWAVVGKVRGRPTRVTYGATASGVELAPLPGQPLPDGFLWADEPWTTQSYGIGGPELFFGPLHVVCRRCGIPFVASAKLQKKLYEEQRKFVDKRPSLCATCLTVRAIRKTYEKQVELLRETGSPDAHLNAARLAVLLLTGRDQVPVDKAIGYSRTARRSEPHAREAAEIEAQLLALRDANIQFLKRK